MRVLMWVLARSKHIQQWIIEAREFRLNAFSKLFFLHAKKIYRGPSSNNYDSYELKYNGQAHRPTNFVSSGGYINPYLSKHGFYGAINPKDRISIGGGKLFSLQNE